MEQRCPLFHFLACGTIVRVKEARTPSAADTYKLAPGLDLRGDPALGIPPQTALRQLFGETIDKELSRSWVIQQRQPEVHGVPE
jgi:hypothetical protein